MSVITIPANTYFSIVSQADADAQALAAAMAECFDCGGNSTTIDGIVWGIYRSQDTYGYMAATPDGQTGAVFIFSGGGEAFGGVINAYFEFCNPTNSDITLHFTPIAFYGGIGNGGNAGIGDNYPIFDNMFCVAKGTVTTPLTERDLVVDAMSIAAVTIQLGAEGYSFSGAIIIS